MAINVIIVGGGKVGARVASLLSAQGHHIVVVEVRPEAAERLQKELPGAVILSGTGSDPAILEAAGISQADVVAAITGDDEINLAATSLARFEFHVPRTIARVNNPKNGWLFTPLMGVDVALSQADVMAHLIAEEMSLGDMMTLLKLRKGEYSLVEEKVDPAAPAVGKVIRELGLPNECVLVAIIRRGRIILPHGDVALQPADEVLALVHSAQLGILADLLSAAAHPS